MLQKDKTKRRAFRHPYWAVAKPANCTLTFKVKDTVQASYVTHTYSLTEINAQSAFICYSDVIRWLDSSVILKGVYDLNLAIRHQAATGIVIAIARLYYYPRSTYDVYIYPFNGEMWTGLDDSGLPTDVKDFVQMALYYDNPWNAFEAGIEWAAAPWADFPSPLIDCKQDESLLHLPLSIAKGW